MTLSRLIMNLRDISLSAETSSLASNLFSDARFSVSSGTAPSRLIGNLGAPLNISFHEAQEDLGSDSEIYKETEGFKGVSDDPLTTGMVLEMMR